MIPNIHAENAYEILGVSRDSDAQQIRQVFRKLALTHHPDAQPPERKEASALVFARINQAYELLRDPDKREHYDRLLDRGGTPDLSDAAGPLGPFAALADILDDIRALDIPDESKRLKGRISEDLRGMLGGMLLRGKGFRESLLDAVSVTALVKTEGFQRPPDQDDLDSFRRRGLPLHPDRRGRAPYSCGWMVVTEVRLIVLMSFADTYEFEDEDNPKFRLRTSTTYSRVRSFWFESLKSLYLYEIGRSLRSYEVLLEDEDNVRFRLRLSEPRLSRLFLVANANKLPLRIRRRSDDRVRTGEYARSLGLTVLAFTLLSVPLVLLNFLLLGALGRTASGPAAAVNAFGLGTALAYGLPLILLLIWFRVYRSWNTGSAAEVIGVLPEDFADGIPEGIQPPIKPMSMAGSGRRSAPSSSRRNEPRKPAAPKPRAQPLAPPPQAASEPTDPVEVDLPEAVRDAFGGTARPPGGNDG
jgi:hypothetical protein